MKTDTNLNRQKARTRKRMCESRMPGMSANGILNPIFRGPETSDNVLGQL